MLKEQENSLHIRMSKLFKDQPEIAHVWFDILYLYYNVSRYALDMEGRKPWCGPTWNKYPGIFYVPCIYLGAGQRPLLSSTTFRYPANRAEQRLGRPAISFICLCLK